MSLSAPCGAKREAAAYDLVLQARPVVAERSQVERRDLRAKRRGGGRRAREYPRGALASDSIRVPIMAIRVPIMAIRVPIMAKGVKLARDYPRGALASDSFSLEH